MSRILVVEDDDEVRELFVLMLGGAGHAVESAGSCAGAGALLDRHAYDLVLADGRLGDGTGLMIADRAVDMGIGALIVTGYAAQFGDALKRHEFLHKPVRIPDLLAAIERVLTKSRPAAQA